MTRNESGAGPEGGAGARPGDVSRWVKRVGGAVRPGAGEGCGNSSRNQDGPYHRLSPPLENLTTHLRGKYKILGLEIIS